MTEYGWALKEVVDVTLIVADAENLNNSFLVTRVSEPGAFVLTFAEANVLINGVYTDLGEDLMYFCSLADELTMGPRYPEPGTTFRAIRPPAL